MDIAKKMRSLNTLLTECNEKYHNEGISLIKDSEYDKKFQELVELEETYPMLKQHNSITVKVGTKPRTDKLFTLTVPMLSLDNVFDIEGLHKVSSRIAKKAKDSFMFDLEPKLDGMAMGVIYEDGVLVKAYTRGDGHVGEDITANAREVYNMPKGLNGDYPPYLEVRGELVISKEHFEEVNKIRAEKGLKLFSNARNLVAGTIRSNDPNETKERKLEFFVYSSVTPVDLYQSSIYKKLNTYGFETVDTHKAWGKKYIDEHVEMYMRKRSEYPYDIDGLVLKHGSVEDQVLIGDNGRAYGYAIAFKFPDAEHTTKVLSIQNQIGLDGVITPVAVVEPTDVDGVTISNITLHNYNNVRKLGIALNDEVGFVRSGGVIPKIISVTKKVSPKTFAEPPALCPSCSTETIINESDLKVNCPNKKCPGSLLAELIRFAGRDAMDIKGIGPSILQEKIDEGRVNEPVDLFRPSMFTGKQAEYIERAKNPPLWKYINALRIDGVGRTYSKEIAKHFKTLQSLCDVISPDDFKVIPKLNPVMREALYECFAGEYDDRVSLLSAFGVVPE